MGAQTQLKNSYSSKRDLGGGWEKGSAVFSETLVKKKTNPQYSEIHHRPKYNKRWETS